MKKLIVMLIVVWTLSITGCNEREDVYLSSEEEITEYVQSVIDEPVSYVRTERFEEHYASHFIFKLDERDIEFEVKVAVVAPCFDALQLGNFREKITITYEEAIIYNEYYVEKRLALAKEYGVTETYNETKEYFWLDFQEYQELEKIAEYIKAVDELYAFKEKKPNKVEHEKINISSKIVGGIDGFGNRNFEFTKTERDTVKVDAFIREMQIMYVYYGDLRGFRDESISDAEWERLLWLGKINKYL